MSTLAADEVQMRTTDLNEKANELRGELHADQQMMERLQEKLKTDQARLQKVRLCFELCMLSASCSHGFLSGVGRARLGAGRFALPVCSFRCLVVIMTRFAVAFGGPTSSSTRAACLDSA
jgi:hypothetical protein